MVKLCLTWTISNNFFVSKTVTNKQKVFNSKFINHLRRIKNKLPMLPTLNKSTCSLASTTRTKHHPTGRKNKSYNPTDNCLIDYYDGSPDGKIFEGFLYQNMSLEISDQNSCGFFIDFR